MSAQFIIFSPHNISVVKVSACAHLALPTVTPKLPKLPATALCPPRNISLRTLSNCHLDTFSPPPFITNAKLGLISNPPSLCEDGTGGTYFLKGSDNTNVAVFKPANEDPLSAQNPKHSEDSSFHFKGILPGEAAQREVFASQIDNGFAGVPSTHLAEVTHWTFTDENGTPGQNVTELKTKTGSLQEFVSNVQCDVDDMGYSLFSTEDVQKIAALDLLIANCDRNGGNILVKKDSHKLVPIDHGFSVPDFHNLSDIQWFEWLTWKQSKQAILPEVRDFINNFDIDDAVNKAKALGIRSDCILTLQLAHAFVKEAVAHSLTLCDIGKLMCCRFQKPSAFENLVLAASENAEANSDILCAFKDSLSSYFN